MSSWQLGTSVQDRVQTGWQRRREREGEDILRDGVSTALVKALPA